MASERKKTALEAEMTLDASKVKDGSKTAVEALKDIQVQGEAMGASVQKSLDGAGQAAKGVAAGVNAAADQTAAAVEKLDRQTASLSRSIRRATAENLAGGRNTPEYFTELGKLQGANIAAISRDFERLAESRKIADQAALSLDKMGLSAKQTAAALRQVPAQFTDIVVSLQGGQAPLTVLLQQGGQLKDVFGGVNEAASALGGYIRGLINPATLAVAAIGGIGAALFYAATQAERLGESEILSGGASGTTIGNLNKIATSLASVNSVSLGTATSALAAMAENGRAGAANIERFTAAAIAFEKAGGPAAENTAKAFGDLAEAPLKATLKLNEAMNYLTKGTYDAIKAAEDQGRTTDAVRIAQEAYFDVVNSRTPELVRNTGLMRQGWRDFLDNTNTELNFLIGLVERLAKGAGLVPKSAEERLRELQSRAAGADSPNGFARLRAQEAQAELGALNRRLLIETESSQEKSNQLETTRKQVLLDQTIVALGLEKNKRLDQELAKTREIFRERQDLLPAAEAAVREKFASKKSDRRSDNAAEKEIDLLNKLIGVSSTFNNELDILRQRYNQNRDSAAEYAAKVSKLLELQPFAVKQQREMAEELRKEAQALERASKERERYYNGLEKQVEQAQKSKDSVEAEIVKIREGKDALQETLALRLEDQAAAAESDAIWRAVTEAESERYRELAKVLRETAAARRTLGEAIELDELSKAGAKAAQETQKAWENTAKRISEGLTDAIIDGGKKAADYIRDLFKSMVLRPIVQAIINPIAGALTAAFGGVAAAAGSDSAGGNLMSTYQAGNSLYQAASGFSSVGTTAARIYGTTYANVTGTGLDGFLASNNAFGTAGGAGGAATTFGAVAQIAAGVAAGVAAGRAISNGYSTGGSGNTNVNAGTAVGTAIGAFVGGPFGAAVGGALGGALGGVVNRAFGRRSPEIERQEIVGSFGASGAFSGDLVTTMLERGGWFRSDRRSEIVDVITGDFDKALDEGGKEIARIAAEYGKVLGLPIEKLNEVTDQFRITLTDNESENSKALEDALKNYGDTLLEAFAPDLEPLRKAGETIAQTIERVGGSLKGVNSVLDALGIKALEASVNGAQAALALEGLFGGIQNLQSAASTYFDRFFSAEEKFKVQQTSLSKVFDDLGKTLPNSRDEFKKLVDAQDLTTESGRQTFAALLSVAGAFDQLIVAADAAAEAARELKRQDIQAQMDALQKAVGDFSILEPTRNLSQQLSDGRNRLQELESGLAEILGTVTESIQDTLARLVNGLRALREYRSGLAGSIQDARIAGMDPAGRIAALRAQEAGLFSELGTATDPVAVAQKLQETIIRRIQEETSLRQQAFDETQAQIKKNRDEQISALRSQITAAQRLQDLAASIAEFNASLRSSDLSPLSFADQLKASQGLFESTLAGAARGDANAQSSLTSNAKAYLDEARAYFGASSAYNDIFQRVTASLDALGSNAPASPQIAILEQQLAALESLNSTQEALAQDNTSLVESLTGLDLALAAREKRDEQAVADAKAAADAQIAEQRAINENLTAQITQAAAAYAALKAELETLNANVGTLVQNANLETVKP